MIIYKIINNITNKIYVGQTVRSFKDRMAEHCRHTQQIIDMSINKHGKENFTYEIIDKAENIEDLNRKEKYWIDYFNSMVPHGYNQCCGGDNTMGYKHKESSKGKMSIAQYRRNMKGEGNPFYGKHHSKETKIAMSKSWENRKPNPENLKKATQKNKIKIINLDTMEIFNSIIEASVAYNLKATNISRVCKKKRKTTGGFHWQYYDEYMIIPCEARKGTCND